MKKAKEKAEETARKTGQAAEKVGKEGIELGKKGVQKTKEEAEKVGFKKEGIVRKGGFAMGKFVDACLLGLLREEWKEPMILTKTA